MRPLSYLVAADKFKGTLSAETVCARIRDAILTLEPEAQVMCSPIADGGDGTAAVIARRIGAERLSIPSLDALHRAISAECYLKGETGYLDMSSASGLARLTASERTPLQASTAGTGQLIRELFARGCRRLFLGLGGSATVDAGFGMAATLGYKFLDEKGNPIAPVPANFSEMHSKRPPPQPNWPIVIGLSDVETTLLGTPDAISIFGPQKGLAIEEITWLKEVYANLLPRLGDEAWVQLAHEPRSGAAGGLGFGVRAFLSGELVSGFSAVAEQLELEEQVAQVDIVITGEGCLDGQSLAGKAPFCLAQLARAAGKPVWAITGITRDEELVAPHFDRIITVASSPAAQEESMREPEQTLFQTVVRSLQSGR
jgi:glycerate 2-kinase